MISRKDGVDIRVAYGKKPPLREIDLTRFNKIATQGAPQMAVDKEANSLSRVYSYYSKFNIAIRLHKLYI